MIRTMTWESVRSPVGSASPLRPPTGRPRAFASGLRIRSPSPRNFDEVACCDETYVSQLSTRSDTADRTFTERDEGFDHDMSPSRGILEKLKNDMNSLEMMRRTEFFKDDSENLHYNRGRPSRDFSSPKQNHRSYASRKSPRSDDRSWSTEKKRAGTERDFQQLYTDDRNDTDTNKLPMKLKILEDENERLQTVLSVLREDSVNDTRKLKEDLHEAKAHEVEMKKELLKVTSDAEKYKRSLDAATEQHESELASLCDKLQSAEEREMALQDKIGSLERSKAENKKLQDELDDLRADVNKTKQDNDEITASLKLAIEEKQHVSAKLGDSESALRQALKEQAATEELLEKSREESIETKRSLKDALDEKHRLRSELGDEEIAHRETREAKDAVEKIVKDMKDENHKIKLDLQQASQENKTIKQLLSEEKNKAEKVRINLEKKFAHYENEINALQMKSIEAEKIAEEQLLREREAFEYEKETICITMRAMEKQKEEYNSALQKMSEELAKSSSHDVKATAALKISFDDHEKTKLELTKAQAEVNSLSTKLSNKSDKLVDCSKKLSRSISEAEVAQKQLQEAKEKIDQREHKIQELMNMTDTLSKKVEELNTQAADYKSKMVQYDTQLKKADATVNASENKSKMLNEEINSLQMELSRVTEILDLEKNDKEGMQQRSNCVSEKNEDLISKNKELEQKLEDAEKRSTSQKEELTSALSSLDEMMKYIETSREEHDNIIQSLETDLSKALEVKHATENQMNELVNEMKNEFVAMKEKLIAQTEVSLEEHRHKIVELETSILEKASEVTSLQHKIKILEAEIEQNKDAVEGRLSDKYEDKLEEMVEKLRVVERENAELKESLAEARMRVCHDVEHKEQGEKIARLDASLQEKVAEATTLQDKINTLQAEVQNLNQTLIDEKESNVRENAKQREEYETKVADEKQQSVTKLIAAEEENVELKKSLEELHRKESQLVELKETVQQKTKNEIQLRGELAHKKQQMTIAESNEKHLQEHVASLEAQIDKLISDYEAKLEELS